MPDDEVSGIASTVSPDPPSAATTRPLEGEVGSMQPLLAAVARTGAAVALTAGTMIADQYRIDGALGSGGMGVVYRAHDLRLERDVAIKLGRTLDASALARLQREAIAIARLNHPNVVTIHQVGELDGRVFIVMELVSGGTVRSWLAKTNRGWRKIVALYAAAGEGLAAAHVAGLVHRDFKPDNVLVGEDERPRVADFGLVYSPVSSDADAGDVPGAVIGTLGYMSPEQLAGEAIDARTDQFSFCASIWEALFGVRPFSGKTVDELDAAIAAGPVAPASKVPAHIVDALRRGLAVAPDDRWPAITPLVAELRRDPNARRRRIAIASGLVLIAGTTGAVVTLSREPSTLCSDGSEQIARVWSRERQESLRAALGETWTDLAPRVEARMSAWVTAHHEACVATRVARSQSEPVLDRRMACLGRVRAELDGFLDELAAAPQNTGAALDHLRAPASCMLEEAQSETPAPSDLGTRLGIENAARVIARAKTAALERFTVRAVGLTADAVVVSRAIGWRPQIAEALTIRARVLDDVDRPTEAAKLLEEAIAISLAERDDRRAIEAMTDLANVLAFEGAVADATRLVTTARSLWERTNREPQLGEGIFAAEAEIALRAGRTDEAVVAAREQARLADAAGYNARRPAVTAFNLARVLLAANQYEETIAVATRAIAEAEKLNGARHPSLAGPLTMFSLAKLQLGEIDSAIASARRAIDIADPGGSVSVRSDAHAALGQALQASGDAAAARDELERSLAIEIEAGGSLTSIAKGEHNLAIVEVALGNLDAAGRRGASALANLERIHGTDHPDLIFSLWLLGHVTRERGDLDASLAYLQRARDLADRFSGPTHYNASNARIELAKTLVKMHRGRDAVELLAPVLKSPAGLGPPGIAELSFGFAQALAIANEVARARTVATDARKRYTDLGADFAPQVAEIDAWLAKLR